MNVSCYFLKIMFIVCHLLLNNDLLNLVSWQIEPIKVTFDFIHTFIEIFHFSPNIDLFCPLIHRKNCSSGSYSYFKQLLSFSIGYLKLILAHFISLSEEHLTSNYPYV